MAALCNEHGLVLGEDGRCVLCRRQHGSGIWFSTSEESVGNRSLTYLLLLCMSAGLGAVAYLTINPERPENRRASRSLAPEPAAAAEPAAEPATEPDPAPEAADDTALREDPGDPGDGSESSAESAALRPHRVLLTPAQQEAMAAARAEIHVVMYQTAWCYICDHAREFLTQKGVLLEEHDIETDAVAEKQHLAYNPSGSVPVFTLEGEPIIGFNASALGTSIDQLAEARLSAATP